MRHKKKRANTTTASQVQQQIRNPDKLDYSDDDPLDQKAYQEAIRAHLNEFEDMAANQVASTFAGQNGQQNGVQQAVPKLTPLPPLQAERHAVPAAGATKGKKAAKASVPPSATQAGARVQSRNQDRIWNTTTNEERERIKEFWLNLGEEERKSLVKVEKEAVLKKMKEQQKHSCSCSVCGRKRTAIEEELEVLYDAYYEELEQYANQQQFPSQSSIGSSRHHGHRIPRQGKITEVLHSDDSEGSYDEDDFSEEDVLTDDDLTGDEDDYSDEYEEVVDNAPTEFFKFGNSLTVKGGILTVADDLLKNDGKKFIEMMEQLAERRMQREEEAAMEAREYDEEDEDDDYNDDDIDSDEYDDEDEEQEALTEEQRMAEGRRMFQIFAARMFEQRVLTAYREKVAQERQAQLLQELEMEDSREKEREAKKLKEKEKKKDKKRQQQLKKEEEKARKDAERLAEEAAAKAEEERKAEEVRKKKEELRVKKEAERKAFEAERLRKEEEKRKRMAEEKAREAKKQEQLAKEKKAKDDATRKEREAKEAAAKEARESKSRKDVARSQRETDSARATNTAKSVSLHAPTPSAPAAARRPSPVVAVASPPINASPAVPRSQQSTKESTSLGSQVPIPRQYQDNTTLESRNVNIPQPQHRAMTPGIISPTYGHPSSQTGSYPRAALGHPPSMPVPLPPPGIGSHGPGPNHDPFGFNSAQGQSSMPMPMPMLGRSNSHAGPQLGGMQGPPGVFSTAPGLNGTSPQPRIGTPQGSRLSNQPGFNSLNGIGSGSLPREDSQHDAELIFNRRPPVHDSGAGIVGAIGRPPAAVRAVSAVPAPIQRPSAVSSPARRTGFETGNVMGSRALLDDNDDDDPIVDSRRPNMSATAAAKHMPSIFSSTAADWNSPAVQQQQRQHQQHIGAGAGMGEGGFGSAALNGAVDEPYRPPAAGDRWGSVGAIGGKLSNGQGDEHARFLPTNPVKWGF